MKTHQHGLTLIELVTSITVIGIAGSAVLGVLGYLSGTSGAMLAFSRAQAVADLYLAEALALPFTDPNGVDGESTRTAFDDVDDFNGLDDATAVDRAGTVAGPFRVRVTVLPGTLGALPAANVRRVDVRVDLPDGNWVLATGYRTRVP